MLILVFGLHSITGNSFRQTILFLESRHVSTPRSFNLNQSKKNLVTSKLNEEQNSHGTKFGRNYTLKKHLRSSGKGIQTLNIVYYIFF